MEFANDVQRQVYERIKPWMAKKLHVQQFGDVYMRTDRPAFGLMWGSVFVQVAVLPLPMPTPLGDDAMIVSRAYLANKPRLDADLLEYLVRMNDQARFGAFGVDEDGNVYFQHAILGSEATIQELRISVSAVAQTADRFDEQIIGRWGGTPPGKAEPRE
jgi:hypothetical protein